MGLYYFIVNDSLKEYIDALNKGGELPGDYDLWQFFFQLMQDKWKDCQINIYPNFDEWGLDYTALRVPRENPKKYCDKCGMSLNHDDTNQQIQQLQERLKQWEDQK
jgi:hypothetical protein